MRKPATSRRYQGPCVERPRPGGPLPLALPRPAVPRRAMGQPQSTGQTPATHRCSHMGGPGERADRAPDRGSNRRTKGTAKAGTTRPENRCRRSLGGATQPGGVPMFLVKRLRCLQLDGASHLGSRSGVGADLILFFFVPRKFSPWLAHNGHGRHPHSWDVQSARLAGPPQRRWWIADQVVIGGWRRFRYSSELPPVNSVVTAACPVAHAPFVVKPTAT